MSEEVNKRAKRANGEGGIYPLKDGTWVGRIMDGRKADGSPNMKTTKGQTYAECRKKFNALKKALHQNDSGVVQKLTIQAYMMRWLTTVKANVLKPKAYDRLEATVLHQIIPYVGYKQVAAFTAADLQDLLNLLAHKKKYSYSTVKKTYDAFNDCFRTALIRREVYINPALGVTVPRKIQTAISDDDFSKSGLHFYEKEEVKQLIAAATEKWKNGKPVYKLGYIVPFAIYTGLRISELLGLKWANVDLTARKIKVVDSLVVVKDRREGAVHKTTMLDQKSTKTYSGRRQIALSDVAYDALLHLHKITGGGTYVFETQSHKPVSPRNVDRLLRCAAHTAGFDESRIFGMHALRHTFASMLFAAGEDVKTVSELMGHSGVEVTYNIYIHLIEETKAAAVKKLVNF